MSFRAGQTFLFPLGENLREHLWVIATEPNDEGLFAIASFTSLKGAKDQTVILRAAEHPFLKWDTCVSYALADISNSERYKKPIHGGGGIGFLLFCWCGGRFVLYPPDRSFYKTTTAPRPLVTHFFLFFFMPSPFLPFFTVPDHPTAPTPPHDHPPRLLPTIPTCPRCSPETDSHPGYTAVPSEPTDAPFGS